MYVRPTLSTALILELAQAMAGVGLCSDASWLGGLEFFVRFANDSRSLTMLDVQVLEKMLASSLATRLRVEDYLASHPSIQSQSVQRPIFILGMPRTGTTLLNRLLSIDPAHRSLLAWEARNPTPPPTRAGLRLDPRCLMMRRRQEIEIRHDPSRGLIHWEFADEPTECSSVMMQEFRGGLLLANARFPKFAHHALDFDMKSSYRYHRRVLQLLQSNACGVWNLKAPIHALYLPDLLNVFDDARLICTHRDPCKVVASNISMAIGISRLLFNIEPDRGDIASITLSVAEHARRVLETKKARPKLLIYDVRYPDLMRDPLRVMHSLYAWLGRELTDDLWDSMREWLAQNRQHKFGRHVYSLDEFGLTERDVRPLFEEYVQSVEVEPEPQAQ